MIFEFRRNIKGFGIICGVLGGSMRVGSEQRRVSRLVGAGSRFGTYGLQRADYGVGVKAAGL